jgi:hypothetical protein
MESCILRTTKDDKTTTTEGECDMLNLVTKKVVHDTKMLMVAETFMSEPTINNIWQGVGYMELWMQMNTYDTAW